LTNRDTMIELFKEGNSVIHITDPKINDYLMKLAAEDNPHLLEMERIARRDNFPIVERLVGRLLFIITKLRDPKLIVELGSGFGYSAYWFARALNKGRIVLTDYREENMDYARNLFRETGLSRKAEFRTGDALEIAKEYENIDILFIDMDKHQYPEAVRAIIPNLSRNALIIADNTLWYGKVIGETRDGETLGIKRFNKYLFEHPDFITSIVPLRDGVLIAYKNQ
jgi:caffeoyl-CoA O-methyltransferase